MRAVPRSGPNWSRRPNFAVNQFVWLENTWQSAEFGSDIKCLLVHVSSSGERPSMKSEKLRYIFKNLWTLAVSQFLLITSIYFYFAWSVIFCTDVHLEIMSEIRRHCIADGFNYSIERWTRRHRSYVNISLSVLSSIVESNVNMKAEQTCNCEVMSWLLIVPGSNCWYEHTSQRHLVAFSFQFILDINMAKTTKYNLHPSAAIPLGLHLQQQFQLILQFDWTVFICNSECIVWITHCANLSDLDALADYP